MKMKQRREFCFHFKVSEISPQRPLNSENTTLSITQFLTCACVCVCQQPGRHTQKHRNTLTAWSWGALAPQQQQQEQQSGQQQKSASARNKNDSHKEEKEKKKNSRFKVCVSVCEPRRGTCGHLRRVCSLDHIKHSADPLPQVAHLPAELWNVSHTWMKLLKINLCECKLTFLYPSHIPTWVKVSMQQLNTCEGFKLHKMNPNEVFASYI